ncbi:uncharacterized protein BT62DRAFT_969988 [Guyanagaster necrorhizus]|uniref:C3H1-type domain-containing protein n=1 Tax=Guyanagaster necrorhizus TaxID=856835 RepID=A0A9P7VQ71_9AGAR|nr:uncharacterized protein BT62DRAFT_969988 [Guyanagaster necrorhizus MCA 3950]KAG7444879.1 hypothetical protein BT62DRAFT_969988 [Guyanagaster necrorhizus MCA 3950]
MASEAQMKSEIARLTATINSHKATSSDPSRSQRSNTYVNPNYKPVYKARNTYIRPAILPSDSRPSQLHQVKEVVLNGVAFQSSSRSLVRKDLPRPSAQKSPASTAIQPQSFSRKSGHLIANNRVYKSKPIRGRRGTPANRNMTLANSRRPYQSVPPQDSHLMFNLIIVPRARKLAQKRMKYIDKPCPRFSTTGVCSRGLTCMYNHDPDKVAICWNFLQGNCSNNACLLSHDPTPERTPLCLHFANKGRCTRENCPFPHVNVGARQGVCRDFAVLGYCEKGLDCDKQHVRECPDFAEKGTCTTKGCKLPHVIRANRRKPVTSSTGDPASLIYSDPTPSTILGSGSNGNSLEKHSSANGQLGDEYVSLIFIESDEDDSDEDEEEDVEDDADVDDEQNVSESEIHHIE